MIKRHTVEIIEELDKDGKVVSRTTTTTDETDDNHYGSYYPPITQNPCYAETPEDSKYAVFLNSRTLRIHEIPTMFRRLSVIVKTAAMSYLRIGSSGKIKTATCFAVKNVPSRIMASTKSTTCFKKESDANGRNVKDSDGNHRRRHSTCVHL